MIIHLKRVCFLRHDTKRETTISRRDSRLCHWFFMQVHLFDLPVCSCLWLTDVMRCPIIANRRSKLCHCPSHNTQHCACCFVWYITFHRIILMSTPVPIDTPPRPTLRKPEEQDNLLQARLQQMLDLQYEQHEREQEEMQLTGQPLIAAASSYYHPSTAVSNEQNNSIHIDTTTAVTTSDSPARRLEAAAAMAGVGQGTLFFPKGYRDSHHNATDTSNNINNSLRRTDVSLFAMHQQMIRDSSVNAQQRRPLTDEADRPSHYGSTQHHQQQPEIPYQPSNNSRTPVVPLLPQANFHPHYDSASGPQIVLQHPHHHDAETSSPSPYYATRFQRAHRSSRDSGHHPTSCFGRIESCWSQCRQQQQQLQPTCHRSFCYGAIDGLLTGSGIVAALVGMQILLPEQPPTTPSFWTARWSIVVLCWAACGSDAICMALSHLWNGHITLQSQGHTRRQMQRFFLFDRNRAKAQLMDWLVQQQGLLKIDAMSLADTLEGYPDLFSSVLMGDPLVSPMFQQQQQQVYHQSHANQQPQQDFSPQDDRYQQQEQHPHDYPSDPDFSSGTYPLQQQQSQQEDYHYRPYGIDSDRDEEIYGDCNNQGCCCACCCCTDEGETEGISHQSHNSNSSNPSYLFWQESQWESWAMMWGFWIASGIPSLLFLIIPYLVSPSTSTSNPTTATIGTTSATSTGTIDPNTMSSAGGATSVASVVVTLTALIMWCLGVWKSQFHQNTVMMSGGANSFGGLGGSSSQSLFQDNKSSSAVGAASSLNWMIFGMETVVILFVCIASACGCGYVLSQLLGFSSNHNHHHHAHNATLLRFD